MASIIENYLNKHLTQSEFSQFNEYLYVVTKWNWNYIDSLKFQEELNELVYNNPEYSVIIYCSHPSCFTVGRGLQRNKNLSVELVDYDTRSNEHIKIPIYNVKRGGGITFHHPSQLVIYPIINLTKKNLKVYDLINAIQALIVDVLQKEYKIENLDYCRELLGLWHLDSKIASVGLQVRRFVTFHGIAINLAKDQLVEEHLDLVFPCGLSGKIYSTVSDITLDCLDIEKVKQSLSYKINSELFHKTNEICSVRNT